MPPKKSRAAPKQASKGVAIINVRAKGRQGAGIGDWIKRGVSAVKRGVSNIASKGVDLALAGVGGVAGVDRTINQLFPGERHAILNGVMNPKTGKRDARAFGQWTGPSTHVATRLKRGDQGLTNVDRAARAHDIRYSLAKNNDDIAEADRIMVRAVKNKPDTAWNKAQGNLIKIKQGLDKLGFRIGSTFGDPQLDKDPELRALYERELAKMAREGFGQRRRCR